MVLEIESQFFERHRVEWLEHHQGKFALIRGEHAEGFFDTAETAYEAGVGVWGNQPFLIKQVLPEDPIEQLPALVYGLVYANPQLQIPG